MGGDWWIRLARPGDAEAIGAVLVSAAIDAWGGYLGAERIERANLGVRQHADLVAVDSEGVFAFVAWDEATGEVTRLFADPRGQGRGAGSALLELAAEALRAAGRVQAWLFTEERNDAAGFYLGRGWRIDGEPRVRDWHGARLVEPRFVRDLDPGGG